MTSIKLPSEYDRLFYNLGKEKIFNHTCQLLIKSGPQGYLPYGSGVLVIFEGSKYIFTAAHITASIDENNPLFINTKKGILPLSGEIRETVLSCEKNIDVAYIRIDEKLGQILNFSYNFLQSDKIGINHISLDTNQYMTLGYPEKNIKIDRDNHIIRVGSSCFLHKLMEDKVFEKYKFDKDLNYIVNYAGKGYDFLTNEKKPIIRRPHGMSGCGLWFISFDGYGENFILDYILIGIMTEYIEKPYDVLIGTKVDVILGGI